MVLRLLVCSYLLIIITLVPYCINICACGTCRPTRKHFTQCIRIEAKKDNRGSVMHRQNGPLVASSWVDKRYINFVGMVHYCNVIMHHTNSFTVVSSFRRQCHRFVSATDFHAALLEFISVLYPLFLVIITCSVQHKT